MLGIIILNYITYNETIKCVSSILETIDESKVCIYIVDNASPNDSYKVLSEKYNSKKNIKIILSEVNGGYSFGNNIGINSCIEDGIDYAIISNNDVIFTENAIHDLYNVISQNNDVIIVGPRIIDINGNYQKSITMKKQSYFEFLIQNPFIKDDSKGMKTKNPFQVYTVSGCCFITNLEKFKQIGAFDQSVFLYNEENILGSQIEKSSYNILYYPKVSVIHAHGTTTGRSNMFVNTEFMKSSLYYWKEYRNKSIFSLALIWVVYTTRWILKALISHSLRAKWITYIEESISIFINMRDKEKRDNG